MEAEGGSKGTRVDPNMVSLHEGESSSNELSLSTASNTTLKDLKMTDAERKKEKIKKPSRPQIQRQEKRRKKSKGLKTRREKKLEESREKNEPREGQLERRKKKRRHMMHHQVNYRVTRTMVMMMSHIMPVDISYITMH
jgi:uncharacterized membrane protein YdbT with pleckstrin-like domain